jgi:membrane protein required for colicin V production
MAIDIIFAIVALYGIYMGFSKGIIKTVFTVLALLLGFMIAVRFSVYATDLLKNIFNTDNPMLFLAGFVLCFILTVVLLRFIAKMLERVLEGLGINFINKIAGGLVIATLFTLIFSILIWFADRAKVIPDSTKDKSITYPYLQAFPTQARTFAEKLKPFFESTYEQGVETLDELERKANEDKE